MKRIKPKIAIREASLSVVARAAADGSESQEQQDVIVSVSSEIPYRTMIFNPETGETIDGYEVLGHADGEVDFSRMKSGLVIQDGHQGRQVGIIDHPEIVDARLCGRVRFGHSRDALELKADALDGIRTNMSVGYFVNRYEEVGKADDGLPILRAVSWTPFEGSFVNVPADPTVGVGRSLDVAEETDGIQPSSKTEEKGSEMNEEEVKACVDAAVKEACACQDEEIKTLKAKVEEMENKKPEVPPEAEKAMPFDEAQAREVVRRFSLSRAVRSMAGDRKVDAGFERECSEQIAKATGRSARGMFIPEAALRTFTGKTNVESHITGNGAAAVATELLADRYIDALVAETVLGKAGVQTMAGLVGDIAIPSGSAVTAGWQSAEDGDATTVTPAWTQITGTPHTATGTAIVSRKLMIQNSIGVDSLLSRLVTEAIARAIETAAFEGSNSSGQPKGLANVSNVGSVSMTANKPTKANLVEFWKLVLAANAGTDSLKYIMSPAVKALLCKTMDITKVSNGKSGADEAIVGGVGGQYLCDREGKVEGYDVLTSGLCDSKKIYFGNWSDLILAFWTGIDLIVDPYTYSAKGAIQLSAFQDCDILCRHPEAFAIGTAAS